MKDLFLAVGYGAWGKGWTLDEALINWNKNVSRSYTFKGDEEIELRRLIVPDDASFGFVQFNDLGDVVWKTGTKVFKSTTKAKPIVDAHRKLEEVLQNAVPDADYDEFMYAE